MRRIDLNDFVNLGASLRSASLVKKDASSDDAFFGTMWLGTNLKKLMGDNVFETGIMKHDCAALISIIEKIEQAFFSRDKSDTEEESFKMFTLPNLERAIQTFRNVFAAECRQASTYNVDRLVYTQPIA